MKISFYRQKWSHLKIQKVDRKELRRLANQIAYSFMDSYLRDCHYEQDYIDLLCEMTMFWEDPQLNGIAAQALFTIIIESLCDEFEDLQTETYNRVITQIISFCRGLPAGSELDRCLNRFGIHARHDLLNRIHKIRIEGKMLSLEQDLKKILVLSRVTIGADVAITSIIIQRLARHFPNAEIVLIGGRKLKDIFGGNSRINIKIVNYERKGDLLERLSSWHQVLEIIQNELMTYPLKSTILVDPDSRLSQLGVLPLISLDHYYFFDSRSDVFFNAKMSMAELTNTWLNQVLGVNDFCYPKVWLLNENTNNALNFCNNLRHKGARRLISINFGVGANPRKALGSAFEKKLLLALLQEPDTIIVLDKGSGAEEQQAVNTLMQQLKANGYAVHHTKFNSNWDFKITQGIIGLQTQIGEVAAIIAHCDEYIGYDSACQHIAAAVGTPCLTIFAGSNNMRFIRRWSAYGPHPRKIVHVDTLNDPSSIDMDDIIIRIMNERSIHKK